MASGNLNENDVKSAHNPRRPGTFSGDYKINRLRLYTPARGRGEFIDISEGDKAAWTEINFYEDIYSSSVNGDITIQEGMGLQEVLPLVGEEVLEVRMATAGATTPPVGNPNNSPYNAKDEQNQIQSYFRIYKIDPPVNLNDNFRQIKLHFISDIAFTNMQVKVQKSYPNKKNQDNASSRSVEDKPYTIADMVRDIFFDSFIGEKKPIRHLPAIKELLVEPTKGLYNACIPNWTPFKAMNFLASRALSTNTNSNGANFVFYETLKGFRFASIETLMQGGLKKLYDLVAPEDTNFSHYKENPTEAEARRKKVSYIPVLSDEPKDNPSKEPYVAVYTYRPANVKNNIADQTFAATEFNLISSFDTLKNLGMGMYANRVVTHDLIQMRQRTQDFYYIKPEKNLERFDYRSGEGAVEVVPDTSAELTEDQESLTKVDESFNSDPGKLCSNNADMIGRPESYISLFTTNKNVASRFADGLKTTTLVNDNGELRFGVDLRTPNVTGKAQPDPSDEYDKNVEEWLAQRTSQRMQVNSVKINFTVAGDSSREVGDLIWFQYPSENPDIADTSGLSEPHKYFSGKYLVTALRHKITKEEYTMVIEGTKDGYRSQISSGFGLKNPRVLRPDGLNTIEELGGVPDFERATKGKGL